MIKQQTELLTETTNYHQKEISGQLSCQFSVCRRTWEPEISSQTSTYK